MADGSTDRIALTGIKPTGSPTLGNYLGMIRPALALAERYRPLYFIADYHALTTVRDADELRSLTRELAATWLALGLDTDRGLLYRQSDVPEIFEITWILSCFAPKGLLNRAHAYKASVDANEEAGRPPDDGVNMGLFNYPVLMAADILSFDADVVPVGLDQKQHVEIARDIADAINTAYGEVLRVPEPLIDPDVQTIPGTDGRKMSKSYDNTLPLIDDTKRLTKQVKRIVTDSRRPEEPKDPDTYTLFLIYRAVAPAEDVAVLRERYLAGGVGYGEVKEDLAARLVAEFAEPRERYAALVEDGALLDGILAEGAERARELAAPVLARLRRAVGVA
mgnify:CR=1 FL=1